MNWIKAVPAAAIIAACVLATASAQSDPYASIEADQIRAAWEDDRAAFISDIEMMNFAYGCRAILTPAAAWTGPRYDFLMDEYLTPGKIRIDISKMVADMESARVAGLTRAVKVGACDYWRENPDLVVNLRSLVGR